MKDADFQTRLELMRSRIDDVKSAMNAQCVSKTVTIKSDFNGQPFGCSKRSLRGTRQTIESVDTDGYTVWLFFTGYREAIRMQEVVFDECAETPEMRKALAALPRLEVP